MNKIKFENEIKNLESKIKSSQSEIRTLMNVDYDITPVEEISYTEVRLNKTELLTKAINNNPELKMLNFQKKIFKQDLFVKRRAASGYKLQIFQTKISGDNNFWGWKSDWECRFGFGGNNQGILKSRIMNLR